MGKTHLASTPSGSHTVLALGATVNATLSCLLNRVVSVGTDSDGRRYVRIEPDIRHAEFVLRDFGLKGSKMKPLTTPGFKVDEKELAVRETEVPLEAADATRYRSCVMRLSFVAQDLGEPVKCLARSMAKPKPGSFQGSQESRTLVVGNQTHGPSLVAAKFPEQHFNIR